MEATILNPKLVKGLICPSCGYFFSTITSRRGNYKVKECPKCRKRFD